MGEDKLRSAMFRSELLNPEQAETALKDNAKVGEAEVVIARYGVEDTGLPIGLSEQHVLDPGTFRSFAAKDWPNESRPMYLDHGNAQFRGGAADSTLKLGIGDYFRETDNSLVAHALYNLQKQVAREALSDLVFDPKGETFSFRWAHDDSYRGDDGRMHTREIPDLREFSQCGAFGAQRDTGLVTGSVRMRGALIGTHSTDTIEGDYDPSQALAALPSDSKETMFRKMFAWADPEATPDPDGFPTAKSAYKFPHHHVHDGSVSDANVNATRSALESLNRTRAVPNDQRRSVYNHLARHLRDAGQDVPELKARGPEKEELLAYLSDDEEFRATLAGILPEVLRAEGTQEMFLRTLVADPEMRVKLRSELEEASKPSVVQQFYQHVWESRAGYRATTATMSEAQLRSHLIAKLPGGHGMAAAAGMPMFAMTAQHTKLHAKGADHTHSN